LFVICFLAEDRRREGVSVFMGTVARHMSSSDPRVMIAVESLIDLLKTPSHSVQKSVAECLAPLMNNTAIIEDAGRLIDICLNRLRTGESYGERKGAAFGLAGMVTTKTYLFIFLSSPLVADVYLTIIPDRKKINQFL
jgi:hypothetical protein